MPEDRQGTARAEIERYLQRQDDKGLLRLITCGSVDDGKSTLLGRLLYDSQLLFEDQLSSLAQDSQRFGTTGSGELDLALLVDGLAAEREQGITIDVAYRFFATEKRKFIVADTPGHEQYTRNMATGASTADCAILLVDARKGVVTQTRRHSYIVSLLGLRHVVVAVNKMDLVGWDGAVFQEISDSYRAFAAEFGFGEITCVPVSALRGDNVTRRSTEMPWYRGPTLLDHLENVEVAAAAIDRPFRMAAQWINRPDGDFRGIAGTVASGRVAVGDNVAVLPAGTTAAVARIVTYDGDLTAATAGQAVTLVLDTDIDVSRGDLLVASDARPPVADQFAADVIWLADAPLMPGRRYLLRQGPAMVNAQVTDIKHAVDVNTLAERSVKTLALNDVAVCNLSLDKAIALEGYGDNPATGNFILIDRVTNATVGCGMVKFALRRAANIHRHAMKVDAAARAAANDQKACVLWFTGLSGAGKSTIADRVEQRLHAAGLRTMSLDGDNVRHGLNRDLGFTEADRVENIRRVGEVAKLMVEAGLITLVSFISPFRSERQLARDLLDADAFFEVFVDASLAVCEARDPKGLYKKARAGEIPNFTGVDSPYEPPLSPDLRLAAGDRKVDDLADQVIDMLRARGVI